MAVFNSVLTFPDSVPHQIFNHTKRIVDIEAFLSRLFAFHNSGSLDVRNCNHCAQGVVLVPDIAKPNM